MQIDDVVWHIINQGHCNFKIKTIEHAFCLYDFNVTGLCNRESCPLANSNYATCKEERGKIFLYIKNVERAHNPNMLWQKVELDKNYNKSLEQIDELLLHYNNFLIDKNKQRMTKQRQMQMRVRQLKIKGYKELRKQTERKNKVREHKAQIAANVEQSIETEVLERLQAGVSGGIYNYNMSVFNRVLDKNKVPDPQQIEQDELELEEEDYNSEEVEFVFDSLDNSENDEDGITQRERSPKKKIKIEYEYVYKKEEEEIFNE